MNYIIENLYPTPIYVSHVKQYIDIQNEIGNSVEKYEFKMRDDWGTHYLSHQNFESDFIKENRLEYFSTELDFHIRNYCRELDFKVRKYKLESWISLFETGNYGHIHSHGYVDLSGVYYYKTNGDDGDLFFECPVPNIGSSFCYYNKFCNRWIHKPEEGKLLLFPGWIKHGITTNKTNDSRISISFNVIFDREVD